MCKLQRQCLHRMCTEMSHVQKNCLFAVHSSYHKKMFSLLSYYVNLQHHKVVIVFLHDLQILEVVGPILSSTFYRHLINKYDLQDLYVTYPIHLQLHGHILFLQMQRGITVSTIFTQDAKDKVCKPVFFVCAKPPQVYSLSSTIASACE